MRVVDLAGLGALCGLLCAGPAEALTISNVDPDAHTITVTVGSDSKQLTVEPEKEVDAACADGCKVKLENGEEYDLKGSEAVSIEDGVIFVDSSPDADDAGRARHRSRRTAGRTMPRRRRRDASRAPCAAAAIAQERHARSRSGNLRSKISS